MLKIPAKELHKILFKYKLGVVKSIKPLMTSGNFAYAVNIGQKNYFLHLSPSGARTRSKSEIAGEIELLKHLRNKGVPILLPVTDRQGKEIVCWQGHCGYLREFIKNKEKLNPSLADVRMAGKMLGKIHTATKNFKTRSLRLHKFGLAETKKNFLKNKNRILKSDFKNKKEFVLAFQKQISGLKIPKNLPQGMVHEDFGKRHALWEDKKIKAVIDFDRSYFGSLILDLGQALRGWSFDKNWKKWKKKRFLAFMSGYESERKLSVLEKKYLLSAIKFGCLERALSFCLHYTFGRGKKYAALAKDELFSLIPQIRVDR